MSNMKEQNLDFVVLGELREQVVSKTQEFPWLSFKRLVEMTVDTVEREIGDIFDKHDSKFLESDTINYEEAYEDLRAKVLCLLYRLY